MSKQAAIEQLKNDVAAVIAGADPEVHAEPGRMMAPRGISLDQAKQGLDRFNDLFQKAAAFAALVPGLGPQYKALIALLASAVNIADGAVNPEPTPALDVKPLRAAAHPEHAPADPAADVPTEETHTA